MLKKIVNQTMVYWLGALVIFADQYSKHLVRTRLALNESWSLFPGLAPYARILHINNTGAAFGMFKEAGLFFTAVALVVSAVILYYARQVPDGHGWIRLALGLQLGGAVGNLIDRLIFGTVTDFISVGTFAIFNVADASISVGVALLALIMLIESRAAKKKLADAPPPVDSADIGQASGT
jgi:signal peptidase II